MNKLLKDHTLFSSPWRKIDLGVLVALLLFALLAIHTAYAQQRVAHFTVDSPPNLLPLDGFHGSEHFTDQPRRFRWSKGKGILALPNPGGTPFVRLLLAGGTARTVDVVASVNQGAKTTFVVAAEPRFYTLLLPVSHAERITLWLESPVIRDPLHPSQKLGIVVSDMAIIGNGQPPDSIILTAILVTMLLYGTLRLLHMRIGVAVAIVVVVQSGLVIWQGMWGWQYGVSNQLLLYGYIIVASSWVALLPLHQHSPPALAGTRTRLARLYRWGILVVCAALPSLTALVFVALSCNASILDFVPYYSDEVFYWHQTKTFTQVGFGGGYYTAHELAAPLEMFRFYVHGPIFPMLYGVLSILFGGWHLYSGVIFNMLLLTVAFGLFAVFTKLNTIQMVVATLFLTTFWVIQNFLVSNMQESIHHTGAILLAVVFALLLAPTKHTSRWLIGGGLLLLIMLSLLRITWALCLVPFFLLTMERITLRSASVALVKAGMLGVTLYVITTLWSSPYPNFLSDWLRVVKLGDYQQAFIGLYQHALTNLIYVQLGTVLEYVQRYQLLAIFFTTYFLLFLRLLRLRRKVLEATQVWQQLRDPLFHIIILGGIFTIITVFYDMYNLRDYRVFAPYIIVSVLVLIATNQHIWLVKLIIISNILIFPMFWDLYVFFHEPNFHPDPAIVELQVAVEDELIYQPNADPWCNTVLWAASLSDADFRLFTAIPAGIGISFITQEQHMQFPLKSQYVIVNPKVPLLKDSSGLQRVGGTSTYDIMVNTHAACP